MVPRSRLAATTLASLNSVIGTHWLIRVELGTVALGVFLLVIGHLGWYREEDTQDDGATMALWVGSLFTAVPLAIGVLFFRYANSLEGLGFVPQHRRAVDRDIAAHHWIRMSHSLDDVGRNWAFGHLHRVPCGSHSDPQPATERFCGDDGCGRKLLCRCRSIEPVP